jgi:hypothetical protein
MSQGLSAPRVERRALLEVLALLLTGTLHVIFETFLHAKIFFVPVAAALWLAYLGRRIAREEGVLREWGFRRDNLGEACRLAALVGLPCLVFLCILSVALGNRLLQPSLVPLLLLYPIWGLAQQFLLQALLAANVRRLSGSAALATALAAVLFGLVHVPDWTLCGLTCGLALLIVPLYCRVPNLWPLGVLHGWLGSITYIGVLGADPWAAFLGKS